jgi:hypothetical protein
MKHIAVCGFAVIVVALAAAPAAFASSAKLEFERYGVMGIFAGDCSKPASRTNGYIVYRGLDDGRVQRDTMVDQTTRLYVAIIDFVVISAENEITAGGSTDDKPLSFTIRVDGPRHRIMYWTEDGVTSVVDGIWTAHKQPMPWVTKCGM